MMTIREILHTKGHDVVTIAPDASVPDAMRLLVRHDIGAVVVLRDGGLTGILTERDLLRAGAEDCRRLTDSRVDELMTRSVITVTPDAEIHTVMDVMTEHRIRHLPVMEGESLAGLISIGDLINAVRQSAEAENEHLHAYIAGEVR
jgi:CBS domain-containing protein